jgi:SpoVK/Ycf46/Vps4 family AAA+-type ATPase
VFLRILELYTGILFLTTNRVGALDEAFMSRIHTQLYYPALEYDQSMKIWATNLKKLQRRKGDTMKIDVDEIMKFAKEHFFKNEKKSTRWNGRQIRNACQAAAALTEHEAFDGCIHDGLHTPDFSTVQPVAKLEVRHFQKVDSAMREFHEYMASVCGEDFSGVARAKAERDDDYVYEQPRRYPEPVPHSPKADAYDGDNGLGLSYGGGGGGGIYGGPPRWGGAGYSPHDRDQRPRNPWGSGGGPGPGGFSRDQERDRELDRGRDREKERERERERERDRDPTRQFYP